MHGYLYFYVIHLVNPEIYLKTGLTSVMIHVGLTVCEIRRGRAVTESTHELLTVIFHLHKLIIFKYFKNLHCKELSTSKE